VNEDMPKPRKPKLPPCPNCGLEGGAYLPVAENSATDGKRRWFPLGFVAGFELECSLCHARTNPERSKAACLRAWKKGDVASPFEQAREHHYYAAIEAEIAHERLFEEPPPYEPPPDDDIPF
jgi:hypothetical protein